ncbi:MAG: hypothetical protein K2L78_06905, partial [Muribaculaceae bacterium]|nr:hypothetical protein [Muribaculaceae bacterium]
MQKKYVLPILMVAPAIPAMQAIDFPAPEASDSQWKLSGVTAGSLTFTDGLISAPLGGTITTTVANLPKGNYKLAMLAGTNNATVSVNGKAIADGAFTLDKKGDIEITVVATDKSQAFAFGIEKIELVFDFAAAKEALGKQLEGIEVATPANPEKPHTEELKALADELAKINADIKALDAETVETYEKYGFDSDNADYTANKIAEAIKAYAGSVKDFNDTVEPENEAYAIQLNNAAVIKTLTDGIASLKEEVAKSAEALKGVGENDLAARNNETLTTIGLDIKKLEDAVAALEDVETRLDPSKDGDASKTCTDTLAGLNEKAAELAASIASDKADDEAYREYTGVVITLTGAHSEAVTAIDAITDNEDYKGDDVFAGKKAEWKNSLSEIVAAAKDKAGIGTTIEGAAGKLETAKEAVAEAQEALTKVVEDANTFADGLNGEYATALEAVDALSTSLLDTTKDVNVPAKFKEGYDSKVKAIEDAIAAMSADINTHYAENDLTAATYADAQAEITDALADLQQYIDNCAPVIAEQAKIDALNKALKEATEPVYPEDATDEEKAAIDASYSFAEDKFQQNIDHITEGIAKLQGELDKVTPENLADGVPNLDTNDLTEAIELLKDGVAKLADIYGKVGAFDKG